MPIKRGRKTKSDGIKLHESTLDHCRIMRDIKMKERCVTKRIMKGEMRGKVPKEHKRKFFGTKLCGGKIIFNFLIAQGTNKDKQRD